MQTAIKKLWPALALLAGALLLFFEIRRAGGINAENAFWLFVGVIILILSTLSLFQKPPQNPDSNP